MCGTLLCVRFYKEGPANTTQAHCFVVPCLRPWVALKLGSGVFSLGGSASIGYFRSNTAVSRDEVAVLQGDPVSAT